MSFLELSSLYAKNLFNFVTNLYDKESKKININLEDEIIEKTKTNQDHCDELLLIYQIKAKPSPKSKSKYSTKTVLAQRAPLEAAPGVFCSLF